MDDIFDELEQSIGLLNDNHEYNLALSYLIELRKNDKEYIYKKIKELVLKFIDEDCIGQDKVSMASDLVTEDSISILKGPDRYELTLKLTALKNDPVKFKGFMCKIALLSFRLSILTISPKHAEP